jgi:RimJ/RimL family protein N-acetyltransferase
MRERKSLHASALQIALARVLEKAGFIFEARLKNNVVKDGKVLDSLLYARDRLVYFSASAKSCLLSVS